MGRNLVPGPVARATAKAGTSRHLADRWVKPADPFPDTCHLTPMPTLRLADVDRLMLPGDLLLYHQDDSLRDVAIARGGRSTYCHAGMLDRDLGEWRVLQMLMWRGGRSTSLAKEVAKNRGCWDWFSTNPGNRWHEFNRLDAVKWMRHYVNRGYGWGHLIADGILHLPIVRFLTPVNCDDETEDWHPPFCSEAVSAACRKGGGVDPVPHLPDRLTEPGDLARSLFYEYRATLMP